MSGFQPVQVPDFGATLGRAQAYGINQLAALAQMRQLRQQQQYEDALQNPEVLSGILGADPAASANALTILAQRGGPMGFQAAMPLIRQDRENAQLTAVLSSLGGGGGSPAPAMPTATPGGPSGQPAAMPASPVGQPPLSPPDAVLPAPGGGMPQRPAGNPTQPPDPAMPQARGVPTFEGLWRIAQAGPRGMEIATKLAPLVAQMNPNLATFNQGGRVWLQNPRTGARVDMGPVDATTEATRTINGRVVRGQEVNGRFTPYPDQNPAAGNDPTGQAADTLLSLSDKVRDGTASPGEIEQWRVAYDAYTAERRDPSGNTVPGRPETPGMRSAREALLRREASDGARAPGQPNGAPQAAPPGGGVPIGTSSMTAEPPGGTGAQPRQETTQSGSTRTVTPPRITPQAAEAARKLEVDAAGLTAAVQGFQNALRLHGSGQTGLSAFNPRSPEGAQLQQAFENLKMALRSEAFANTGVLQPGENRMLDEILRNPRSLTGLLSSVPATEAQLGELMRYVEAKVNAARRAADLPPLRMMPDASAGSGGGQRRPLSSFQR